ncbi:hypothetical protein [Bacillus sp. HNG]|nr:hypothetical protein [Bacillus sp. HNG]
MKKDEHVKNQVLYITNPAYDALHSEHLLEENDEENHRKPINKTDVE